MLPVLHKYCFTPLPNTFGHSCRTRLARSAAVQRHPGRATLTCRAGGSSVQVTLQTPSGQQKTIKKDFFSIGTAGGSDLLLEAQQVAEEHACIEVKAGRLYCSALVGDPDNFLDETRTWLNDSELRPGCSYLLTPGAKLAFGNAEQCFIRSAQANGTGQLKLMGSLR
ncbi:TPA: hypothetical protein ACH3X1_000470 [Trebouxia sp. C0004]